MEKQLSYYKSLQYPIRIDPDPEGGFVASIPDLPGCNAYGDTAEQALVSVKETKDLWLESYFETHGEAPEPSEAKEFAGRILLRIPKYLHEKLYYAAQSEGVSLNKYLLTLLAERNAIRTETSKVLMEQISSILFAPQRESFRALLSSKATGPVLFVTDDPSIPAQTILSAATYSFAAQRQYTLLTKPKHSLADMGIFGTFANTDREEDSLPLWKTENEGHFGT
jgi:antitoxin HicB